MAFNISYKFQVIDGFSGKIKKFQTGVKRMAAVTQAAAKKINRGFKSMAGGVGKLRSGMTGLAVGITAFGLLAGNSIIEFEKGINSVQAALNITQKQMIPLRNTAKDLGRTTAFTAGQAAEAMTVLAVAAFDAKKIIGILPGVLSLAAAGSLPLADAAGIMSNTLKGFGLEVKDTKRVIDVLAKAAVSANTTVAAMGGSLSNVASVAKLSGVSMETTIAALAVLQDKGIQANKASVGLRGAMLKLQKITPESAKAMKKMGINIGAIKRLMSDGKLIAAFQLLNKANLTGERAAQIFGLETANVAATLADSTSQVKELTKKLSNLNDDAKRMADTKLQGLPGAFLLAKSAFEGFQLALGDAGLTNRFIQIADFVKNMSNRLGALDPKIKSFAVDMGIVLVVATAILVPLAGLLTVLGLVALAFAAIPALGFIAVNAAIVAASVAVVRLIVAWEDLKRSFLDTGFLGAVSTFFGFGPGNVVPTIKSPSPAREVKNNLTSKPTLANFSPGNAVAPITAASPARTVRDNLISRPSVANVNLNGNIDVTANGGAKVNSAELGLSGASGDLGINLAGAQ